MTNIGTSTGKAAFISQHTQYPVYYTRLHRETHRITEWEWHMVGTNTCGLLEELLLLSNKTRFHCSEEKKSVANQLCHHT